MRVTQLNFLQARLRDTLRNSAFLQLSLRGSFFSGLGLRLTVWCYLVSSLQIAITIFTNSLQVPVKPLDFVLLYILH